ncbi:TPA: hypothetical protein ACOFC4_000264 [Stenotrophomonas maltophilia]
MSSASKVAAGIISILGAESCNLTSALIQAQILAHHIGQTQLSDWVGWELKGYPEGSEVPAYRMIRLQPRGCVSNGFVRYPDHPLPTLHLEDGVRERILNARISGSVAAIESYGPTSSVANYPPEFAAYFADAIDSDFFIESLWGKPAVGAYAQILVEIRSRLLNFVLDVAKTLPKDDDKAELESTSMKNTLDSLFQNAIFGHNATIQFGNNNTANVTNTVTQGDLSSVVELLRSKGMAEEDLRTLEVAVEADGDEPKRQKKLGPAVASWMGAAVTKAASGAWDITVSAAGTLVAGALSGYYGFPIG